VSLVAGLLFGACATLAPKGGSADDAQRVAFQYGRLMRWGEGRTAANLLVPEQRTTFKDLLEADRFDEKLKITEFELKDVKRSRDAMSADVRLELSWYVEPSATVKKENVKLHMVYRQETWLIDSVAKGPIELPPVPLPGTATDGGEPGAVDGGAQ
jgi:hypothetical protein